MSVASGRGESEVCGRSLLFARACHSHGVIEAVWSLASSSKCLKARCVIKHIACYEGSIKLCVCIDRIILDMDHGGNTDATSIVLPLVVFLRWQED